MKRISWIFFLFLSVQSHAQLKFQFTWKGEKIALLEDYPLGESDSIQFTNLKCYLSNIELIGKGNKRYKVTPSVFLIDAQEATSFVLDSTVDVRNFKSISLTLGLDSVVNTSGDLEGALDPILGMYWAWNSGYIHFKFMGKSTRVQSKSQAFEFHLGGYRQPNETYFTVELPLTSNTLELDLYQLFTEKLNLTLQYQLMIPGKLAHELSLIVKSSIRMK
jgi:hypothetical protein